MNDKPQEHSELVQRILTGTRWATVLRVTAQVFSWLSTILVVRFISPEDYGLNAMLEPPMVLLTLVSVLGLNAALVQAREIDRRELRSVFGFLLTINGVLFAAFFFGSSLLAAHFREPRLAPLAQALAFVFLLTPFRVIPNALLDRVLDFKFKAQAELVVTVISAISTLALAYWGAGVWALVIGVLVNKILLVILLMIMRPWFVLPSFDFRPAVRLMTFGGTLTIAASFALASDMVITIMAGPAMGPELLGIFAVAAQFAQLPLSKGTPIINQTMMPAFSKFQDDKALASYYLQRLLGVASIILVPAMIGLASVSHTFVLVVLGREWLASAPVITVISIGMVLRLNTIFVRNVIGSMGSAKILTILSFLQLCTMIILTLLNMKNGVMGLAIAWVCTEALVFLATIQLGKRILDVSLFMTVVSLRPAIVSSAAMSLSVIGSRWAMQGQPDMLNLATQIIVGALTYIAFIQTFFRSQSRTALKTLFGDRFA